MGSGDWELWEGGLLLGRGSQGSPKGSRRKWTEETVSGVTC